MLSRLHIPALAIPLQRLPAHAMPLTWGAKRAPAGQDAEVQQTQRHPARLLGSPDKSHQHVRTLSLPLDFCVPRCELSSI
jgi:hypothetical protein